MTTASVFTGTGPLLRFYLRLDRVRIGIWAAAFFVLIYASVLAMESAYPTQEALQGRAGLMHNPAAIMMTGPAFSLDNYTFGAMLANELSLWTLLPAAIMSILLVVRRTRQEEETGRMETLRALPVGRYAPTTATFTLILIANLAVAAAVSLALILAGLPAPDSVAFGVGTGLLGILFGAVAAFTSQLTEHSRTASGMALGALALAAVIRGFGDVIEPTGSWLSWLSPIAWVQQTMLYVDLRWWPLALLVPAALLVMVAALRLSRARDLGAGLLHSRPGPSHADARLLRPFGIAHRLLAGNIVGWTVGLMLFALAFGTLASSLDTFVSDNPTISEWVPISMDDLTTSFAAIIIAFLAVGPAILTITSIIQLKREEEDGRLDELIVTGSSRANILFAWIITASLWATISMVLLGFSTGIGLALVTGDVSWLIDLTVAAIAYLPAILVSGSLAAALYGLTPRATPITWAYVAFLVIEVFLGDLLNLPEQVRIFSPIWQTPLVPHESFNAVPPVAMLALAAVLYGIAALAFTRRDIDTT